MKDGKRLVITIGRQFGSGGCEVGIRHGIRADQRPEHDE